MNGRKIIRIGLVLAILLSVFFCFAAANAETDIPVETIIASGDCGAEGGNVQWKLNSDGVLTIWGTGAMEDWDSYWYTPWRNYYDDITSVVIESGVTTVGESAFQDCDALTSVKLPDGLTSIGDWAFDNCSGLESIELPDSLTSIGDWAFSECALTTVKIPANVIYIGKWAFGYNYELGEITVDAGNKCYASVDGILYEKTNNKLLLCPCGKKGTVTVPDGTLAIDNSAFYNCGSVTGLVLPGSLKVIGELMFNDFASLTEVRILEGVTTIARDAFSDCYNLKSVVLPSTLKTIANHAFYRCTQLSKAGVNIPSGCFVAEKAFWVVRI